MATCEILAGCREAKACSKRSNLSDKNLLRSCTSSTAASRPTTSCLRSPANLQCNTIQHSNCSHLVNTTLDHIHNYLHRCLWTKATLANSNEQINSRLLFLLTDASPTRVTYHKTIHTHKQFLFRCPFVWNLCGFVGNNHLKTVVADLFLQAEHPLCCPFLKQQHQSNEGWFKTLTTHQSNWPHPPVRHCVSSAHAAESDCHCLLLVRQLMLTVWSVNLQQQRLHHDALLPALSSQLWNTNHHKAVSSTKVNGWKNEKMNVQINAWMNKDKISLSCIASNCWIKTRNTMLKLLNEHYNCARFVEWYGKKNLA